MSNLMLLIEKNFIIYFIVKGDVMLKFISHLKFLTAILLFTFLLNGCAAILKGTTENVNFNSKPEGAKIFINGQLSGNTPAIISLESHKSYNIEIKKDGYESTGKYLTGSVGGGYVFFDIILGLVPVIIDAATGAWYSLDYTDINVTLEKK
jgi:hypothetical protein